MKLIDKEELIVELEKLKAKLPISAIEYVETLVECLEVKEVDLKKNWKD